ncbi:leucine-rich repeat-containing protein 74A-like [Ruditapes philippinarum]|uniref:leucine-rich repeat-containing protein 74A-like n=1 Tax=Ruditapes philippinarum TaxID=129788 RepID=UPI00295BC285|nr:leucine-rich repeat-containing protein 74A-like [Ruditapes philippinarum]
MFNKSEQKQNIDCKETVRLHTVKWQDTDNKSKTELSDTESTSVSKFSRVNRKNLSHSGDLRTIRSVLKTAHYSENKYNYRPVTVGSTRDKDIFIAPRWESIENQKCNLKLYRSDSKNTTQSSYKDYDDSLRGRCPTLEDKSEGTQLPTVKFNVGDNRVGFKSRWTGIKTVLKEKVQQTGDVYNYFSALNMKKRMKSESSSSVENGLSAIITSPVRSDVSRGNDEVNTESCEESQEVKHLSISDSDEYDTDLEIDQDFGKKDMTPLSDINIGRNKYILECDRWKTSLQQQVFNSLPERSMTLKNRSLGYKAVPPICAALRDNLRVERLNLDGVDITDDAIQYVAEMLLDNITITHLNVANNTLGVRGAQVLGHVLVVTGNITHLNISGNKLDDNASWYITSSIGSNESMTHLDISYNELGEQAGVLMGSALARNTKLGYLNMSWNKVCGKGGVAIFRALMLNTTLEVLNISWNGLGYDGAVALSKCLKRNVGLTDLDVSNNRLNWRCAFLMAEGLRSNATLVKLKIGHNPLTTTGGMDILEAVSIEESAICLLDFTEIPVLGAADLLAATISRRRTFKFIHGGIVPTHDKLGQRLGRELNPMLRIIEYLRLLGLRPLELMKSFDKTSSFELPRQDFIDQIKKIGVKLHPYEIDALANSISGKGYNKNVINYRKLSVAVRDVVKDERDRKLREREEWLQIKTYHESILKKGTLDEYMSHSGSTRLIEPVDSLKMKSFQTIGPSLASYNSSRSKPGSVSSSKLQLSLCSQLVMSKGALGTGKQMQQKKKLKKMISNV